MPYVFISYSTKEKDKAEAMQKLLNDEGITTWMAPYNIPVGKQYPEVINKAIKDCSCVVLMLSNAAQNSTWVSKEIERAINYNKPLFPVQLENVVLNDTFEIYISNTQIVAIQTIDKTNSEIGPLIEAVAACTGVALKGASSISNNVSGSNTAQINRGVLKFDNGDVYEGELKDGKMNGRGVYRFAYGDVLEGEWEDGKINGHGVIKSANDDVYEGEYKDDKRNGHWVFRFADGGVVIEQEFKDGKMNGHGVCRFADGAVYEGEWRDGKRTDTGV